MREPPQTDAFSASAFSASAFATILQVTQVALHAFVRHLTDSGEDARDIVQDVYIDAWRAAQRGSAPFNSQADSVVGMEAVRRWLFHVAFRRAVSHVRRRRAIRWESLDMADEATILRVGEHSHAIAPFENQILEGEALCKALAQLR